MVLWPKRALGLPVSAPANAKGAGPHHAMHAARGEHERLELRKRDGGCADLHLDARRDRKVHHMEDLVRHRHRAQALLPPQPVAPRRVDDSRGANSVLAITIAQLQVAMDAREHVGNVIDGREVEASRHLQVRDCAACALQLCPEGTAQRLQRGQLELGDDQPPPRWCEARRRGRPGWQGHRGRRVGTCSIHRRSPSLCVSGGVDQRRELHRRAAVEAEKTHSEHPTEWGPERRTEGGHAGHVDNRPDGIGWDVECAEPAVVQGEQ